MKLSAATRSAPRAVSGARRWIGLALIALSAAPPLFDPPGTRAADTPEVNLLKNPGFEGANQPSDNLWAGVDADGYLAGFRFSAEAIADSGFGSVAMPPTVVLADLDGDGKPDLLTADPTGFFRFYRNRGTAAAPRFMRAELVPLFLSTTFKPDMHIFGTDQDTIRFCPRFALADWRHAGLLDLMVGNYYGEVLFVPNAGSPTRPVFRQPAGSGGINSARLPTSEKHPFWGNLLAPAAIDLDRRGQLDLLLGEGTYSANSVHLLRNTAGGGLPKFNDAGHTHLAYGDGREQLLPAVVDYDGDGYPDLLVADRTGEVSVYLNPGKSQPPGAEFKRASTVSFGGQGKLPGLCSLYTADYNGDGLFDLILGLPNGRIGVALNTGTKGAPTFGPIQEIKSEAPPVPRFNAPEGWRLETNAKYGNALAYLSVVDAAQDPAAVKPPEGTHCLKAGYTVPGSEVFIFPAEGIPGALKHFIIQQNNVTVNNNKPCELSFRVKGSGVEKLHYGFFSYFAGVPTQARIERGERGEIKNKEVYVIDSLDVGADFSVATNWLAAGGTLNVHFNNPAMRAMPTVTGVVYVEFWATSLASVLYLDDFRLVQK